MSIAYKCGVLRYVVPFYFVEMDSMGKNVSSYNQFVDFMNDKDHKKLWQPIDKYKIDPDIYEHITKWIQPESGEAQIGCSFRYLPFTYSSNRMKLGWICDNGEDMHFTISELGITVFKTGVGFVWYSVAQKMQNGKDENALEGENTSDLLEFSNRLKELSWKGDETKDRLYYDLDMQIVVTQEDIEQLKVRENNEDRKSKSRGRIHLSKEKVIARINEIMKSTNLNKKIASSINNELDSTSFRVRERSDGGMRIYANMRLGAWLRNRILSECDYVRFFSSVQYKEQERIIDIPDKALVFGYIHYETASEADLQNAVCRLAKGYDEKYQIAEAIKKSSLQLFDDACCFISREGCAYGAGKNAADFFVANFRNRYETHYFWLYILLLQQSYATRNFARMCAEVLPSESGKYLEEEQNYYADNINTLLLQINTYMVKNRFSSVSSIHHVNDFYLYGYKRLDIDHETSSLHEGLSALASMQESRNRETKERREKENEQKEEQLREEQRRLDQERDRNEARQREEDRKAEQKLRDEREQREKDAEDRINRGLGYITFLGVICALCDIVGLVSGFRAVLTQQELHSVGAIVSLVLIGAGWIFVAVIIVLAIRSFNSAEPRRRSEKVRRSKKKGSGNGNPTGFGRGTNGATLPKTGE